MKSALKMSVAGSVEETLVKFVETHGEIQVSKVRRKEQDQRAPKTCGHRFLLSLKN